MDSLSRDEFVALFLEAHPRLWTVAAAVLGDRDLAEDVVQDAAMTGLDRLDSYERGTNFLAWMSQIVRFTALNQLKQLRRRNTAQAGEHMLEGAIAPALANPTSIAPASQFACGAFEADQLGFDDQLAAAVAKLAPERRACLLLRIVQSMPYEEIAVTLGIPASTAMSHVHRAKHALKAFLDGEPPGKGGEL
jgi:RNA polymerase sigma-70 factor, ECF subfamily